MVYGITYYAMYEYILRKKRIFLFIVASRRSDEFSLINLAIQSYNSDERISSSSSHYRRASIKKSHFHVASTLVVPSFYVVSVQRFLINL